MRSLSILCQQLIAATMVHWPEGNPDSHFNYRAFVEQPDLHLLRAAKEFGFEMIGCGNFTAVFTHEGSPGLVFKLNAGTYDHMAEYHEWLMQQSHPHLPAVYHVERYGEGCVAVSEQLSPDCDYPDELGWHAERDRVMDTLYELVRGAGFDLDDTHAGNILFRNGCMVINDPYTARDSKTTKY